MKRVFRYLEGHLDYSIIFKGNTKISSFLKGYLDSDFVGNKEEYKLTIGFIFYLVNSPITYGSKL